MKKIKFSHHYSKLEAINCIIEKPVELVEVLEIELENLSKPFLDYDTDNGLYELPKRGKYLLLLFKVDGVLFTTLRSAYPESKVNYYKDGIGEDFKIEIV